MFEIEVVYAGVDRQVLLTVAVASSTSLRAAVQASGIAAHFPEADLLIAAGDIRQVGGGPRYAHRAVR